MAQEIPIDNSYVVLILPFVVVVVRLNFQPNY